MQKVRERNRTRQITWIVDLAGDAGKSIFTDILDVDPTLGCVLLNLDYYRSFRYSSALAISEHIKRYGNPGAIIIDAPRNEENMYLHEIYAVLEEINNGRLFGSFQGKTIKERMPRGIPVIVFTNSPPIVSALSGDRWDIKALYRTVDGKDVFIQDAQVSSNVHDVNNHTITWQNLAETVHWGDRRCETESDNMLFDMYSENYLAMEKLKDEEKKVKGDSNIRPGIIKKWGAQMTAPTHKAPEYIQRQAQRKKNNEN